MQTLRAVTTIRGGVTFNSADVYATVSLLPNAEAKIAPPAEAQMPSQSP
jgi:hypothetical protein